MNVDTSDKHYVVYRQMSSFAIESVDWFHRPRLKPYGTGPPSAGYSFFVPELTVAKARELELLAQG